MSQPLWYALVGVALFCIGLAGLVINRHLLRRVLSVNVMSSGVFLIFVALAKRAGELPDPVPLAMVLTGLVVSVSATALALVLIVRVQRLHGSAELPEDRA
ncbi:MAG: cation:proton antiporter subunit C [Gammaproteobacteria bacterium]|nr:cation:proton antiporter subunit C [Gammaproteobacteria bacterium]